MVCIGVLHSLAESTFDRTDANGVTWTCIPSSGYYQSDGTWVTMNNIQITAASGLGDEVVVPDEIEYQGTKYPVMQIGSNVFKENKTLKKVTLSKNIKTLGGDTFSGCSSLSSIDNTAQITNVEYNAFYECKSLTSIDLSSCETLGYWVFYQCSNLVTVTLKQCKSIGSYAFYGCNNLQTIGDISNCKTIEQWAFVNCSSLKSVDLSNCTTLGENAFYCCYNLTSVGNTSLLTTINDYTFSGCNNLESIDLSHCTSIGQNAFGSCTKLQSIDLTSCKYIGNNAFNSCNSLATINNMTLVTMLPDGAFSGCTSLKEIDLSSCSTIGSSCFSYCTSLTTVKGIEQFTTIPSAAFCQTALESLNLPKCTSISSGAFKECPNLKSINLPLCETIGQEAFYGCASLETVSIPECKTINGGFMELSWGSPNIYGAFANCTKLEKIELPKCTTIEGGTFYGCKNLASISTPVIETIGKKAFSTCNSLNEVSLPASIKELGYRCFDGNVLLTIYATSVPTLKENDNSSSSSTSMGSTEEDVLSLGNYVLTIVPAASLSAYKSADVWKEIKSRIFPMGTKFDWDIEATAQATTSGIQQQIKEENLKSVVTLKVKGSINSYDIMIMRNKMINLHYLDLSDADVVANSYEYYTGYCSEDNVLGPHSFSDLSKLITVKLPNSVKYINGAFANCSNLKSAVLPESLISTGMYQDYTSWNYCGAFANCSMLKEVTMPSCETLGEYAFYQCSSLEAITLPQNLKKIGNNAFAGSSLKSIIIPDKIETIGSYAFQFCGSLKTVEFPSSLRTIESYAFQSCSQLEKISLPGLTYIADYTFSGCSNLQEVRVPSTLERIGNNAFSNCNKMNNVYTYTVLPISINQQTFTNFKETVLWVPTQSYDNYYWNTQWSQFLEIREFNEPYTFFYLDNVFVLSKRFEGTPDIDIRGNGALTLVGSEVQKANLVTIKSTPSSGSGMDYGMGTGSSSSSTGTAGTLIADGNLDANQLKVEITMEANRWYFLSFPFDIKIDNITAPGKYVIRKYDGAKRASSGSGGWVDLADGETTLHQGTGYIFQSAKAGELSLLVEKDQFGTLVAKDISTTLDAHAASSVQDAGWNFIGNPQTSYMDASDLGYNAPITYWNGSSYEAVRPGDDELVLHPFQAFFVQKPDGVSDIEFKAENRMTKDDATKKSQAARSDRMTRGINAERQFINLTLSDGTLSDNTRIVFNEKKSQDYEIDCDAAKFDAGTDAPQLYSIEAKAGKLAINERPAGSVKLGYSVKKAGTFTLSAKRMDVAVLLQDNVTNATYDLADGDYQFTSEAGTFDSRFVIVPTRSTTGIADIASKTGVSILPSESGIYFSGLDGKTASVYNTGGTLLATKSDDGLLHLMTGVYLVKVEGMKTKVMVK